MGIGIGIVWNKHMKLARGWRWWKYLAGNFTLAVLLGSEIDIRHIAERLHKIVESRPILISSPPYYKSRSPFSRATRGILAFDFTAGELVFLKDYWRADVDGIEKEVLVRHSRRRGKGSQYRAIWDRYWCVGTMQLWPKHWQARLGLFQLKD